MIDSTLSPDEAGRAAATLARLRGSGLDPALTGGMAIAWHMAGVDGAGPTRRPLHDLDLVVEGVGSIPDGLGADFEIRHLHPDAPPGRMLAQLWDPSTALRVDVFGAHGDTLSRCAEASLSEGRLRVVSREDLAARLASLLLDLALGEAVAPKHASDFSALVPGVDAAAMAAAWADHRRRRHPESFAEARAAVLDLVAARPDLLVTPDSPYRISPCPRCRGRPPLGLRAREAGGL
ncbi:hypothetical protein [Lichenibacterium dinghuense]|uniref:hypothetical protein n=1 Tax=Lichenibacterium dinghuense TaxID=2895977 RepID=UPI001F21B8C5|nr:hypothetical protein [Lichenibacterium sp. 6Y81]